MVDTETTIGWRGVSKDDVKVSELRRYLAAHNGIKGLEILEPTDVDRAVQLFHRDGFVVLSGVLNPSRRIFSRAAATKWSVKSLRSTTITREIVAHTATRSAAPA